MANRYIVMVDFDGYGQYRTIHRGNNYDRAAARANFWDERCNVKFVDTLTESAYDRAMRRFDEAIAKLKSRKEIVYG